MLYIVFFLLFRYVKNEKARYIGISAFVLAYCAGVLFMGHGDGSTLFQGEWWFNATPSFILGVFWARFEKPVFSFAKKHYAWLTPLAAVLTVGGWFLNRYALSNISYWNEYPGYPGYKEKWICFAVQAVALPLFVATIMLIGMKLKVNNRAILPWRNNARGISYPPPLHYAFLRAARYRQRIFSYSRRGCLRRACGLACASPLRRHKKAAVGVRRKEGSRYRVR